MKMPAASTEYVYSTLAADHDLTGKVVEVALPVTKQAPQTWFTATVTDVSVNGGGTEWTSTFRILVGPADGVVTLVKGATYDWTSRLQDNPEVPTRIAGTIQAT